MKPSAYQDAGSEDGTQRRKWHEGRYDAGVVG